MSHLKAVTSRIKLGTCENRRLSWVMITVPDCSSITKNTVRYAMIHTALFYIPVNFAFNLPHYVTTIAICTTQAKKKSKKDILKIEKNKNKNNGYQEPSSCGYKKLAARGFEA